MKFVSTRDENIQVSFKEAVLSARCPRGGFFVPANFPEIDLSLLTSFRELSFPEKMARCLSLFLSELEYSRALKLCYTAFNETDFSEKPLQASALNPYKKEEQIIFLERGPAGVRQDYANALLREFIAEWLVEEKVLLLSDSRLSSVLSLAASTCPEGGIRPVYFLDRRFPKSRINALSNYLQKDKAFGFLLDKELPQAEIILYKIFHSPDFLEGLREKGYQVLFADGSSVVSLLTQMSLLLISYADFVAQDVFQDRDSLDMYVSSDDLDLVLAILYLKSMGLPFGHIFIAENSQKVYSSFFRTGRFQSRQHFSNTIAPSLDNQVSPHFEPLLFELLGRNRELLKKCAAAYDDNENFILDRQLQRSWRMHLSAVFNSDKDLIRMCRSLYDRTDYLLDAGASIAFCARQVQRSNVEDIFCVVSSQNPLWSLALVSEALFHKPLQERTKIKALITETLEESGIPLPRVFSEMLQGKKKPENLFRTVSGENLQEEIFAQLLLFLAADNQ